MIGRIDPYWLEDARINETPDSKVEDWIAAVHNCQKVKIGIGGTVFIQGPQTGHYLTREQIDETIKRIEVGV